MRFCVGRRKQWQRLESTHGYFGVKASLNGELQRTTWKYVMMESVWHLGQKIEQWAVLKIERIKVHDILSTWEETKQSTLISTVWG